MRPLPPNVLQKIKQTIQTRDNHSSFMNDIWITRPCTEMIDGQFIDGPVLLNESNGVTDFDISVCHPIRNYRDTSLWECHITNENEPKLKIEEYILKEEFDESLIKIEHLDPINYDSTPVSCAIAFDGRMPKDDRGIVQFITEQYPWVFAVYDDGKLMAKQINTNRSIDVLSERNCTDVTAVRAMASELGNFDFGLVCFFILSGSVYYRQFIDGEWMNAEIVTKLPEATWVEIAAFRTWDYRVGLHAKNSDGEIYELFTQYMGIGKLNTEHISVDVEPHGVVTEIHYTDIDSDDYEQTHIATEITPVGALNYAWSVVPIAAVNRDLQGNYGVEVKVDFDYPQTNCHSGLINSFYLTDSNGLNYACTSVTLTSDGMSLIFEFVDFNLAWNAEYVTVHYVAPVDNGLQSPVVPTDSFAFNFVPTNLVKPDIDPPEVVRIWNE